MSRIAIPNVIQQMDRAERIKATIQSLPSKKALRRLKSELRELRRNPEPRTPGSMQAWKPKTFALRKDGHLMKPYP